MRHLRSISAAAVSAVALTHTVWAADMPTKAPVPAAPARADWTGFYAGVNLGYSVSNNGSTLVSFVNSVIGLDNAESYKISPNGVLGGLQLGYNWQAGPVLFGVEGDIQATGQKNSVCVLDCTNDGTFRATIDQKLPWLATVRGRLGWVVDGSLLYITGGGAFGQVKTSVTEVDGAAFVTTVSESKTKSGWTVGGGIESALAGNWTAKIEYLYVNLGSQTFTFVDAAGLPSFITATADMRDHIIRAGLNYRFNGPVVAAPNVPVKAPQLSARVINWTGFYAGVNVGYGLGRDPTSYFSSTVGETETFNIMPGGFVGGVQAGYNWQFGNVVAGLESDIQFTNMRDSACVFGCIRNSFFNLFGIVEQKLPWFGTTRGRVGYVGIGGGLFYLTGGFAYGEAKTSINHIQGVLTTAIGTNETKTGWTVGAGIEMPLDGRWKAKVEYLYMDLGSQAIAFSAGPFANVIEQSSLRENIFRLGLNYAFN